MAVVLATLSVASQPAGGEPSCRECVVPASAHLEILNTFVFSSDLLSAPSFVLDGFDGTTVWLASDRQQRAPGHVMRIDHNMKLSPVARDVLISGSLVSGFGIAAAIATYDSVRVWGENRLSSDLYDVPTRDSVGKETGFDVLGVDRAGTLWLRRRSAADPKDAALLFALRSGDQQFVPVPLPAGLRGSFECGTMFARSLTTNYEIAGGNFEIRQTSIIPCGWSTTSFGVVHQQTDGTPRMLLLMPQPKEFSRIPPSLPFSIGPNGDAWVWFGYALCHVALNEQVACAPVHVEGRRDAEIDFARDGTIWFSTGYQTLVHAMFVQD